MTDGRLESDDIQLDLWALMKAVWDRRIRIVLVSAILCALVYGAMLFVPKEYESSASLLIEPRDNIFVRATNETSSATSAGVTDDVVVSSQVELIQSPDTLRRVIRDLNLTETQEFGGVSNSPLDALIRMIRPPSDVRDAEEIALVRLTKKLSVGREGQSRVVSITVTSEDRELAATIANAIADAHVNRRAEQSVDDTAEARQWLETEIAKLRAQVSASETRVAQFRVDNDLFVGPNNVTLLEQQMSDISRQITEAQERRNTAASRAELIRNLINSGRPTDGVPDVRNSVVIQALSEDKATLQGQLAQLSASLLDNHPDVQAVRAQISEIDNQITIEARRVASALEAEAEIEATLIQSLNDDLARLKLSASTASDAGVQLQELEREAKAQRDLLETYLSRYSDATSRTDTNAALPDVRIITLAVPGLNPAYPKTGLILAAVLLVSLALQVGVVLFRALTSMVPPAEADEVYEHEGEGIEQPAEPAREEAVYAEHVDRGEEEASEPEPAPEPVGIRAEEGERRESLLGGLTARVGRRVKQDAQPEPEPARTENQPSRIVPAAKPRPAPTFSALSSVTGDLVSGKMQTVMVLGLDAEADCAGLAEQFIISALDNGLSVALVDAGSGTISDRAGITDLAAHKAEFGEVVQTTDIDGLSEVCWGTLPRLTRLSPRPATLAEALADIYEVIVIMVGTAGAGSNLKSFEGIEAGLVLAAGGAVNAETLDNISERAKGWGFAPARLVEARMDATDVA